MLRRVFVFGCALAISAGSGSAQVAPVFDDSSFEVISIEPGSKAIVRSDGRDFYCDLTSNANSYVQVGQCSPFVNVHEAAAIDVEMQKITDELAAEAAALVSASEASVVDAGDLAAETKTYKLNNFEEVRSIHIQDGLVALTKATGSCVLDIGDDQFSNQAVLPQVLRWLGMTQDQLDPKQTRAFQQLAVNTLSHMIVSNVITFDDDRTKIRLMECS